jgi:hypothetical protein
MYNRSIVVKTKLNYEYVAFYFEVLNRIFSKSIIRFCEYINECINNKNEKLETPIELDEYVNPTDSDIIDALIMLHTNDTFLFYDEIPEITDYECKSKQKVYNVKSITDWYVKYNRTMINSYYVRRIQKWFRYTLLNWRKRVKLQLALVVKDWYDNPDNLVSTKMRTRAFTSLFREIREKY